MDDKINGPASDSAEHPMDFLLTEDFSLGYPQVGDIREGRVVAHRKNEILIDIGAKSEGIIGSSEIDSLSRSRRESLAVGSYIPVYVVNPEDDNGNIILSYAKALEEEDWEKAAQLFESQDVFQGKVTGYNKGGLLVMLGRLRGFVPSSQLSPGRTANRRNSTYEERLSRLVGEEIFARVIEVDRERNRLILSERAAMREVRAAKRAKVLETLEEGEVREGFVVNLANFGAFVDIGGLEGLVHLSELSWKRVNHPSEAIEVGDNVEVYVLNVDRERNRVALSMKRLEPDPWTNIDKIYSEGELLEATVSKLTKYGAFARVNDDYGLEGLIHVSELSSERVEDPGEVVAKNQVVTARVIRVDAERRQLGLSLKQVASEEYLEADLVQLGETEEE